MPPLVIAAGLVALGAATYAALSRAFAPLNGRVAPAAQRASEPRPTLRRDPATGEYRPG